MGFDIYGLNPTAAEEDGPSMPDNKGKWTKEDSDQYEKSQQWREQVGIYFRNNVWAWHPLWDFVINTCMDIITPEDAKYGHSNDHHEIDAPKAYQIGQRLKEHGESGFVDKYVNDRNKEMEDAPDIDCVICHGVGKRAEPPLSGPGTMKCNACNGTGKRRPYEEAYYLDKGNIEDFSVFCINSGGFSIR